MQSVRSALKCLVVTAILLMSGPVFVGTSIAQYGDGAYGSCAYGQSCPDDTDPPPDDSTPDPSGGGDTGNITDPDGSSDSGDSGQDGDGGNSGDGTDGGDGNDGSGTGTTGGGGGSSTPGQTTGRPTGVLGPAISFVQELPEEQQALLPYYFWILLMLLAIILLMQAYLDRKKIAELRIQLRQLKSALEEQQNFLRLVLHHLNTPLALVKNTVELLGSDPEKEAAALQLLQPASADLATTIDSVSSELTKDDAEAASKENLVTQGQQTTTWRDRLYYLVPIGVAAVFGFGLTYLLYLADAFKPVHQFQYQLAVAAMSSLIFINAVRIFRLSRFQRKVLRASKELAEKLDAKRRAIITRLSGSLGGIVTALQTGHEKITNAKYQELFGRGLKAITSIFTKTKASVEPLSDQPSEVSLPALITRILADNEAEITKKQIAVSTEFGVMKPIRARADDLKLALESVIGNAILYNKEGGSLDIRTSMKRDVLHVEITDSGIGMDRNELSKLYKPFYQADDVLQFDHGGMSISLYATRQDLQRLGGDIHIESEKNHGSKAMISLPATA